MKYLKDVEQKTYKHSVGFSATCPECGQRKRMTNCRDVFWFICPCGYQVEVGKFTVVQKLLSQQKQAA